MLAFLYYSQIYTVELPNIWMVPVPPKEQNLSPPSTLRNIKFLLFICRPIDKFFKTLHMFLKLDEYFSVLSIIISLWVSDCPSYANGWGGVCMWYQINREIRQWWRKQKTFNKVSTTRQWTGATSKFDHLIETSSRLWSGLSIISATNGQNIIIPLLNRE